VVLRFVMSYKCISPSHGVAHGDRKPRASHNPHYFTPKEINYASGESLCVRVRTGSETANEEPRPAAGRARRCTHLRAFFLAAPEDLLEDELPDELPEELSDELPDELPDELDESEEDEPSESDSESDELLLLELLSLLDELDLSPFL
jgi:hypothetical protein